MARSEKQEGFLSKLKAAVASTKNNLVARIEDAVKGKKVIDAELLEDLEAVLIGADIGAADDFGDSGKDSRSGKPKAGE